MIRWSSRIGLREDDETTYHYAIGMDDEDHSVWSYDISWFQHSIFTRAFIVVHQLVGTQVKERVCVELESLETESLDDFYDRFEAKLADIKENTYAYMTREIL